MKCQGCKKEGDDVVRYRQNTQYVNEEDNWKILCPDCRKENDDYWSDMWAAYYSGCL